LGRFGQSLVFKIYHFLPKLAYHSYLMLINISTHSAIHSWRPACWLKATGTDAANFLQGQFTNDLRALRASPSVYGLWLSVKGKVLADSFVLKGATPDEFWIGSYFSPAAAIRERLEAYIIADDVTLEDRTAEWHGVTVLGEAAAALLQEPHDPARVFVFPGRRDTRVNAEFVYRGADGEPAWVAAATRLDAVGMLRRRIRAGIPAVPVDAGPGDLPNEAGLEGAAISYTKGCYLGQEVMARLKSMGQVRRRLRRIRGTSGPLPPTPAAVFAAARQVGELRSAVTDEAGWIGLAMLSRLHVKPDTALAWSADGPAAIEVLEGP